MTETVKLVWNNSMELSIQNLHTKPPVQYYWTLLDRYVIGC